MHPWVRFVTGVYTSWRDDRTIRLGAGLAYYGLFALASVLTLSLSVVRLLTRSADTAAVLTDRLEAGFGSIGADMADVIAERLDGPTGGPLGVIGIVSLLVSGSLFFLALEDALNHIWHVPVRSGVVASVRRRLVSLAVLLAASLVLVGAAVVQTIAEWLEGVLSDAPGGPSVVTLVAHVGMWVLLAATLTVLLRILPAAEVGWRPAVVSGALTSVLLIAGTATIGWYLRTFGVSSISGAAASILAVLVWIFYEAQILLGGAQVCKVLTGASPGAHAADDVDAREPASAGRERADGDDLLPR